MRQKVKLLLLLQAQLKVGCWNHSSQQMQQRTKKTHPLRFLVRLLLMLPLLLRLVLVLQKLGVQL